MRIVIDMQGAQTESRYRGIGRYTMSFANAVVRNKGEHDIILALNGMFPDTIESIRVAFDGLLPQENIRVWHAPGPVREGVQGNESRREVAELLREAFLASLQPDVVHITSLFEGFIDDAVTSIGRYDQKIPVTVSLYDLIPLLNPDHYFKPNPRYAQYYQRKLECVRQSAACLAISEFTRQESVAHIGVLEHKTVNVSTAVEPVFQAQPNDEVRKKNFQEKFNIYRSFVLYAGGADERKNLTRLIQAYAALPREIRRNHQLVLAGKMPDGDVVRIWQLAKSAGLMGDELIITGYVSDEVLIQLYSNCKLFVFASWHEGFGLPALEAMACGAPVIGSNVSSLPEVIGLDEALFDPYSVDSITTKLKQVLEDSEFCAHLRAHGQRQVENFSWDETAKRAISVWEALDSVEQRSYQEYSTQDERLYGALAHHFLNIEEAELGSLSSCIAQNQQSGIERQILLDISELCQRDAATGVQRVVRGYLKWLLQFPPAGFRVEPVYATHDHGYRYARRFTAGFLGNEADNLKDTPIRWQRGDIFFGLDMQHHVQLAQQVFYELLRKQGVTVKFLVYDLLPIQLKEFFRESYAKELHEQWLTMVAVSDGAICISKATADAYENWLATNAIARSPGFKNSWVHIGADIESSAPSGGLPSDAIAILDAIRVRPTFLCVSTLEPRKGQQQLVDAMQLLWLEGLDLNLVLVGKQGWKVERLAKQISGHPEQGKRLFWLQGISDEYLEQVYAVSSCLVAASINEGFGLPLIEAAHYEIPIIARDIPVFREVAGQYAFYFQGETPVELAEAMKEWLKRYKQGEHPKSAGMPYLTWCESTEKLKIALTEENYPRRQLLVDISELVQRDARTGIQRVVRSILSEWVKQPPQGFRVEPVYATLGHGYRYARRFISSFLDQEGDLLGDEPIEYAPGDIFLGLDLQPQVQILHRGFFQQLRREGCRVIFVVYDLLCIKMPEYFVEGSDVKFSHWLEVVSESDGAVCISKAVSDDFAEWLRKDGVIREHSFKNSWFHLGADVGNSVPSTGLPNDFNEIMERLAKGTTFLMVGTLEPRKAHAQVLDAFDQLWERGLEINLVVIGKQGWLVDTLVKRLCKHPERNKHLFWLEGVSDEYLEKIYTASTCLIAASEGEGFGLPLIEAAQHKLPIIARDIPVFREVAEQYAYYFQGKKPEALAVAIENWLKLFARNDHPKSDAMPWITWAQSTQNLWERVSKMTF